MYVNLISFPAHHQDGNQQTWKRQSLICPIYNFSMQYSQTASLEITTFIPINKK